MQIFFNISLLAIFTGKKTVLEYLFDDTHRERMMFHSIQYRNGWLVAFDLFDMFTQSIKFYALHYHYSV